MAMGKGHPCILFQIPVVGKDSISTNTPDDTLDKLEKDLRHLAVSVTNNIDEKSQWTKFCQDSGGLMPLMECIKEGARTAIGTLGSAMEQEGFMLTEQEEARILAASIACRGLRDLCNLSQDLAVVITDGILQVDNKWKEENQTGVLGHLCDLLMFAKQCQKWHAPVAANPIARKRRAEKTKILRERGRISKKRDIRSRDMRLRCPLYIIQFFLTMTMASDNAVEAMRSTPGLIDAVSSYSSFARTERTRRWLRYPGEVLRTWIVGSLRKKRKEEPIKKETTEARHRPFVAATSIKNDLGGNVKGTANKLLATLGCNRWTPKIPGQKGLRVLCLDGGGSRGMTTVTMMQGMVDAMGGVELCDRFDMIVGTSTGAILAFLVGLRREPSWLAKKRYDSLIKRIFVNRPLKTPIMLLTTALYDEGHFMSIMEEILADASMLDSRADPSVPLVVAVSTKMSATPKELCLFRNYNYGGGELPDAFVVTPEEAKKELGMDEDPERIPNFQPKVQGGIDRNREASRYPGSFRVLQRFALRASTAAPVYFKPVVMRGEKYCDGGMSASNPSSIAIHEARTLFPNIPIELVVSLGTGRFLEEKSVSRIGWDGIIGQVVQSATDAEGIHHVLEDILGQSGSFRMGGSALSGTRYIRFNPLIGGTNEFPIDETEPAKLIRMTEVTKEYLQEPEQQEKLREMSSILNGKRGWRNILPW
eukprot:CAMPEP_0118721076 /NCGR_PEP_ID=MMETSP0800-20121206/30511_1 /TAXON_ID=210618 ORGANISM="Striatella unipunctata, Strain CCMP2910" /NCGR_SAMPLE_ID=MMETSP0800 /ASSEMBLY_ACC=CAM_ASM_000638 /LENGTH=705 /DNA_ID=CAMNT_0006628879 /DNA_START=154 /DNA_END=2271 /DNA_ORIENTATION=-